MSQAPVHQHHLSHNNLISPHFCRIFKMRTKSTKHLKKADKTVHNTAKRVLSKNETNAVKGFAILAMLFYHLFHEAEVTESMGVIYYLPKNFFYMLSSYGNICVAIFAFLSAYGITKGLKSAEEKSGAASLRDEYKSAFTRWFRLAMHFFSIYLLVNIIWFKHFDISGLYGKSLTGAIYFLLDATGLSALFGSPMLNETWWYLDIAVKIIFTVPLIRALTKKIGWGMIPLTICLTAIIPMEPERYILVAVLGVTAAQEDLYEKIVNPKESLPAILRSSVVRRIAGTFLMILFIPFRQNYVVYNEFGAIADAVIALVTSFFIADLFSAVPLIEKVPAFLGKHSANIFFTHTFFYLILWREFTFSPKYAVLILLLLLAESLALSIVITILEYLFNKAKTKICKKRTL